MSLVPPAFRRHVSSRRDAGGTVLLHRGDHFFRSFRQRVGAFDGQAAFLQALLPQFDIRTFKTHHQRHLQIDFLHRGNHAVGDHVAFHDAAENVDQNRLPLLNR